MCCFYKTRNIFVSYFVRLDMSDKGFELWPHVYLANTTSAITVYMHTYIIGHYNPSAGIIDLVSVTTYVVCVNFHK